MRIGFVVPHIFMHRDILPKVIFSPGSLALDLVEGFKKAGNEVTLFSPGPVETPVKNITADLSYFEEELRVRGDSYIDLLKKHPLTFITLARQVQAELLAKAFEMANSDELDIIHIYTNEEDIALPFAKFCRKPVVFTHHDPFNFLVKYKNNFPKYKHLNWISMSYSQRKGMPEDTNWVGNIYHGLDGSKFSPLLRGDGRGVSSVEIQTNYLYKQQPTNNLSADQAGEQPTYIAYLGRIVEPKGVHLAIQAVKKYNELSRRRGDAMPAGRQVTAPSAFKLKIAGKHYSGFKKDTYWEEKIKPFIDDDEIEYVGHIDNDKDKNEFLGNAKALIIPSTFEEPFGMVMIEALACGTPVIGLNSGAIPEVVENGKTGFISNLQLKTYLPAVRHGNLKLTIDEESAINGLVESIGKIGEIDRSICRQEFEKRFTLDRMVSEHLEVYERLASSNSPQSPLDKR